MKARTRKLANLWKVIVCRNGCTWTERPHTRKATYEYVQTLIDDWLNGHLRSPLAHIYVDVRDGDGMKLYETINLQEMAKVREAVSDVQ